MDPEATLKSVIRGMMCLVGIIGNSWLCLSSLPKSISRLRPNDILFINLAVSNLITNYFVDTLNLFNYKLDLPVGQLFCGFRFFLAEFSETSSILTTMFITMYWHQKLVGSLKRGGAPVQMDNLHVITALLTGSWTIAFAINVPRFFFVGEDSENITIKECKEDLPGVEAKHAYDLLYIILINLIPLSGILYASVQITITLLENNKRMKKINVAVASTSENRHNINNNVLTVHKSKSQSKSGSLVRAAKSVVAVAILCLICWVIHFIVDFFNSVSPTGVIADMESFIGASYTSVIPYIYLHGVQKLTCSRS